MEGLIIVFGLLALTVGVGAALSRKAGFSSWYGLLFPLSLFIPLLVLAIIEWPVRRELGWLRVATGGGNENDMALAVGYALSLERQGEWSKAVNVYETLARQTSDVRDAQYLQQSASRLQERIRRG